MYLWYTTYRQCCVGMHTVVVCVHIHVHVYVWFNFILPSCSKILCFVFVENSKQNKSFAVDINEINEFNLKDSFSTVKDSFSS